MKKLFIIRHGQSDIDTKLSDFERVLTSKGNLDAQELGKHLQKEEVFPDVVISSPAFRAKATAKLIAKELGCMEKIVLERNIYEATRSDLLQVIRSINDQSHTVILVGHNPALSDLGHHLVNFTNIFTPCSLLEIDLDIDTWHDIDIGDTKLIQFKTPLE